MTKIQLAIVLLCAIALIMLGIHFYKSAGTHGNSFDARHGGGQNAPAEKEQSSYVIDPHDARSHQERVVTPHQERKSTAP